MIKVLKIFQHFRDSPAGLARTIPTVRLDFRGKTPKVLRPEEMDAERAVALVETRPYVLHMHNRRTNEPFRVEVREWPQLGEMAWVQFVCE